MRPLFAISPPPHVPLVNGHDDGRRLRRPMAMMEMATMMADVEDDGLLVDGRDDGRRRPQRPMSTTETAAAMADIDARPQSPTRQRPRPLPLPPRHCTRHDCSCVGIHRRRCSGNDAPPLLRGIKRCVKKGRWIKYRCDKCDIPCDKCDKCDIACNKCDK